MALTPEQRTSLAEHRASLARNEAALAAAKAANPRDAAEVDRLTGRVASEHATVTRLVALDAQVAPPTPPAPTPEQIARKAATDRALGLAGEFAGLMAEARAKESAALTKLASSIGELRAGGLSDGQVEAFARVLGLGAGP